MSVGQNGSGSGYSVLRDAGCGIGRGEAPNDDGELLSTVSPHSSSVSADTNKTSKNGGSTRGLALGSALFLSRIGGPMQLSISNPRLTEMEEMYTIKVQGPTS